MPKTRKVAHRTCIGCREVHPKSELIRIVRTPNHEIIVDPTGKANGRGAYICASKECLTEAAKTGRLAKALDINISKETLDKIIDDVENLLRVRDAK